MVTWDHFNTVQIAYSYVMSGRLITRDHVAWWSKIRPYRPCQVTFKDEVGHSSECESCELEKLELLACCDRINCVFMMFR